MWVIDPELPHTIKHLPVIWVVRPRSNRELFSLALELGNLHVPVEIMADEVLVAPDGPVEEVFERMGLNWEIRQTV
jgi:urease accessory protein UreE